MSSVFPLYVYRGLSDVQRDAFAPKHRTPNLDPKLYAAMCAAAGIDPADQAGPDDDFREATGDARPSEVKVFDYIYGVLHSPDYRLTYAEFLKIDFPRIPYPTSPEVFAHISEKGEALRRLHLMEGAAVGDAPYPFVGLEDAEDADLLARRDIVAKGYPKWEKSSPTGGGGPPDASPGVEGAPSVSPDKLPPPPVGEDFGRVLINPHQYFAGVPETAWTFPIGGHTPAQKWLKDRRGRLLSTEDVFHYQKIIKILTETDRIMREIELPLDGSAD